MSIIFLIALMALIDLKGMDIKDFVEIVFWDMMTDLNFFSKCP